MTSRGKQWDISEQKFESAIHCVIGHLLQFNQKSRKMSSIPGAAFSCEEEQFFKSVAFFINLKMHAILADELDPKAIGQGITPELLSKHLNELIGGVRRSSVMDHYNTWVDNSDAAISIFRNHDPFEAMCYSPIWRLKLISILAPHEPPSALPTDRISPVTRDNVDPADSLLPVDGTMIQVTTNSNDDDHKDDSFEKLFDFCPTCGDYYPAGGEVCYCYYRTYAPPLAKKRRAWMGEEEPEDGEEGDHRLDYCTECHSDLNDKDHDNDCSLFFGF